MDGVAELLDAVRELVSQALASGKTPRWVRIPESAYHTLEDCKRSDLRRGQMLLLCGLPVERCPDGTGPEVVE